MTAVILGTGSRVYSRPDLVRLVLRAVARRFDGDVVLRYGAARRGADRFMADCWRSMGLRLESFPADWNGPCQEDCDHGGRRPYPDGTGNYCPGAGPRRNRAMVDKGGITEVHGWPEGEASGTLGTLEYATAAGLTVYSWPPQDARAVLDWIATQAATPRWPSDRLL